jgi:hypothetical protein
MPYGEEYVVGPWLAFLHTLHQIMSDNKHSVFYLDENCVNWNRTLKIVWQDPTSSGGHKVSVGKGSWLTMCHVSSSLTGFTLESKLVFRLKLTKDCHEKTNLNQFSKMTSKCCIYLEFTLGSHAYIWVQNRSHLHHSDSLFAAFIYQELWILLYRVFQK